MIGESTEVLIKNKGLFEMRKKRQTVEKDIMLQDIMIYSNSYI